MPNAALGKTRLVVVFVHGIFSAEKVWTDLIGKLKEDPFLAQRVLLRTFEYPSPKFNLNPLRRIPEFKDIADSLRTFLNEDAELSEARRVFLVGHSQGGLVIQRFLADTIAEGRGKELSRIRGVVLFATPNDGSELFLTLRQGLSGFWRHPQEEALRPFNEEIAKTRRVILEHVVYANTACNTSCPIRFDVYTGEQDGIVPAHSAKGCFPNAGTVPGDHFSIIRPTSSKDRVITVLANAIRRGLSSLNPDTTLIRTDLLSAKNQTEVDEVERLMTGNFVPQQDVSKNEFRHWLSHYEETFGFPMRVISAKKDGEIKGYSMFHENIDHNLIVIDYLASDPDAEIHGVIFKKLIDQLKNVAYASGIASVVFEVEDPNAVNDEQHRVRAKARIRHFQSQGAQVIGDLRYLAPDMDNFGVAGSEEPFFLMHAAIGAQPSSLRKERVQEIVCFMYKIWYRNWFSLRFHDELNALDHYVENLYQRVMSSSAGVESFPLVRLKV